MYKVILLDLDDTILDFKAVEKLSFEKTLKTHDMYYDEKIFNDYVNRNEEYWRLFEVGKMPIKDVVVKRFKDTFGKDYPNIDYDELNEFYLDHLGDWIVFIDGALDLLKYLREKGYKLYIVSNGLEKVQNKRFARSHLAEYVDGAVYSGDIGANKPDVEFFEKAMKKFDINVDKKDILMIGDSLTSDIKGANNFGVDCIWYNSTHRVNNRGVSITYEVDKLSDITKIL